MKPVILVVDDHKAVRATLLDWLGEAYPQARFLEAESGEEAVDRAPRCPHLDVVLMDISLPKMSGIEAARRIKDASPGTHIVMLTIHHAPEYRQEAAEAGACAFITKDRAHKELVPILNNLLSSSSASP